ncbi:MAG: S-layer homology domain-containing protein, partial [Oscillospiraceae bacterium]|nr:S-layer homology domain-containing protein [Oscillospiraceae bacterium]
STLALVVDEIVEHTTSVPIGDGYVVLTAAYASGYEEELEKYAVGDLVALTSTCTDSAVSKAKWASGGGDILVDKGALTDSASWDKAITASNPRTAVGVREDGTVIWFVVEGRRSVYSVGADLTMLAEQMAAMGCVKAMNLDGGGASAMSIRKPGEASCTLVNAPSDGTARPTGGYALLVCRTATENKPERLFLKNNGVMVLSGASVQLEPAAADRAMRPIALQSSISATVTNGTVKNGVYTAGTKAGPDEVVLASGDAHGSAMVYTVTAPDTVVVKNAETDREITSVSLRRGESIKLDASLKHLGRDVVFRKDQVSFSADETIGTITADGVFTAGNKSNLTGNITIKAGETEWKLPVTIPAELEDIEGHWSEQYVQELFQKGIVNGVTPTEFRPNDEIRRADFVLMLYRAAGKPAVQKASTFSDVPKDAYYADAVAWAQSVGIAGGTDLGTFEPSKPMLREQGFTFLYRYLKTMGQVNDETPQADLSGFKDASQVSAYALTPIRVLVGLGTVSGDGGMLMPRATMTRGQMAKVLCLSI